MPLCLPPLHLACRALLHVNGGQPLTHPARNNLFSLCTLPLHTQIDLCAVPKKRNTLQRKHRRIAGQRMVNRRFEYKNYKICLNCGSPVLPHHLCMKCKKMHPVV